MIVPMKRVHLLFQNRHSKVCLEKVQELGVLHIDQGQYDSEDMQNLQKEQVSLKRILKRLRILAPKQAYQEAPSYNKVKVRRLREELDELIEKENANSNEISRLEEALQNWAVWGEFDPKDIVHLRSYGIDILLFSLSEHHMLDLDSSGLEYFIIREKAEQFLCAVVQRGLLSKKAFERLLEKLPLPLGLPEYSAAETVQHIKDLHAENRKIEETLRQRLFEQSALYAYSQDLEDKIEFEKALIRLEDLGDDISVLSGYVPCESLNDLKLLAKNYSFGLALRDVDLEAGDAAPTKLKQNFISRLINPVLSFLEVTPAYHEPDISFSFFSFFTVFVAMIMSDAVYGLAIILLALVAQIISKRMSTFVQMLYVLGLATFFWGAASGSWFGARSIAEAAPFRNYTVWQLAVYPDLLGHSVKEQQNFIMWLCFSLGSLHLIIAHFWRLVREIRELKAITNLGSIGMINGLYWILLQMVGIEEILPAHAIPSLIVGLGIVICFGQQQQGISFFKGILQGLAGLFNTFLDTVGLFGDIMSYIRLFAVGIASFSIASSFNSMGMSIMGIDGNSLQFLLLLAGALVLILGHLINFVLSCLSVIVHAVRLNMLEFSSHIGLEWSGHKYQPFTKLRLK